VGDKIKNQQWLYQGARCGDREGVEAQVEENYEMEPSKYEECWEECCQTAEIGSLEKASPGFRTKSRI
jgi:hypothetical protein